MEKLLYEVREELKRIEHQVYVSLKYTRTVDIIRNALLRIINFYDASVNLMLKYLEDKINVKEIPEAPRARAELVISKIQDDFIKNNLVFYLKLRKIIRSDFSRLNEYRRHVTMIAYCDGEEIKITIDELMNYYYKCKEFLEYIEENIIKNEEEN